MEMEVDIVQADEFLKERSYRKANFSHNEVEALLEEISKYRNIIIGLKGENSHLKKREVWRRISFKMNMMFGNDRVSHELRKKWKDLKSRVKLNRMIRGVESTNAKKSERDRQIDKQVRAILEGSTIHSNSNSLDGVKESEDVILAAEIAEGTYEAEIPPMQDGAQVSVVFVNSPEDDSPFTSIQDNNNLPQHSGQQSKTDESKNADDVSQFKEDSLESLQIKKLKMKIKWLESEIIKNDSIAEVNKTKADYIRAKMAKLGS